MAQFRLDHIRTSKPRTAGALTDFAWLRPATTSNHTHLEAHKHRAPVALRTPGFWAFVTATCAPITQSPTIYLLSYRTDYDIDLKFELSISTLVYEWAGVGYMTHSGDEYKHCAHRLRSASCGSTPGRLMVMEEGAPTSYFFTGRRQTRTFTKQAWMALHTTDIGGWTTFGKNLPQMHNRMVTRKSYIH